MVSVEAEWSDAKIEMAAGPFNAKDKDEAFARMNHASGAWSVMREG
jgi:hypothetical protein